VYVYAVRYKVNCFYYSNGTLHLVADKLGGNPRVRWILLYVYINYCGLYNNLPAQNDEHRGQNLKGELIVKIRVTVVQEHAFWFK
jgi:hypothetical protein